MTRRSKATARVPALAQDPTPARPARAGTPRRAQASTGAARLQRALRRLHTKLPNGDARQLGAPVHAGLLGLGESSCFQ